MVVRWFNSNMYSGHGRSRKRMIEVRDSGGMIYMLPSTMKVGSDEYTNYLKIRNREVIMFQAVKKNYIILWI